MDNDIIYITAELCSRGCGKQSTHISKKGVNFCHKNPAKCPVVNPKGKKKKSRAAPVKLSYEAICEYGCGEAAKYIFSNGKHCCSKSGGNCTSIRKKAIVKINEKKYQIQENGKTLVVNTAEKISKIKRQNIDENGLDMHYRSARKVSEIKRNNFDEEGLNKHQQNGIKYTKWLETAEGLAFLKMKSERIKEIMSSVDENGVTEARRRAQIMVKTKLNNIDENGLNGFERAHLKSKNTGFVLGVFYQSLNEKRFLESIRSSSPVTRGPCIHYKINGNVKRYLPDYLINNKLYEIKSSYTMFGQNNCFLEINLLKLTAAVKEGYDVYVVIDDEVISFLDFVVSLSEDQYLSISPVTYSEALSLARSLIS